MKRRLSSSSLSRSRKKRVFHFILYISKSHSNELGRGGSGSTHIPEYSQYSLRISIQFSSLMATNSFFWKSHDISCAFQSCFAIDMFCSTKTTISVFSVGSGNFLIIPGDALRVGLRISINFFAIIELQKPNRVYDGTSLLSKREEPAESNMNPFGYNLNVEALLPILAQDIDAL